MLATLVTIVTLLNGGPRAAKPEPPQVLTNTTIKVFRDVGTGRRPYVELYEGGELTMRLRPGLYSIEAKLYATPNPETSTPCGSEPIVNVRIGHRKTQRIKLWCNVP
jgi:hypothetical protein